MTVVNLNGHSHKSLKIRQHRTSIETLKTVGRFLSVHCRTDVEENFRIGCGRDSQQKKTSSNENPGRQLFDDRGDLVSVYVLTLAESARLLCARFFATFLFFLEKDQSRQHATAHIFGIVDELSVASFFNLLLQFDKV